MLPAPALTAWLLSRQHHSKQIAEPHSFLPPWPLGPTGDRGAFPAQLAASATVAVAAAATESSATRRCHTGTPATHPSCLLEEIGQVGRAAALPHSRQAGVQVSGPGLPFLNGKRKIQMAAPPSSLRSSKGGLRWCLLGGCQDKAAATGWRGLRPSSINGCSVPRGSRSFNTNIHSAMVGASVGGTPRFWGPGWALEWY